MRKKITMLALLFVMATALYAQQEIQLTQWLKAGPVKIHEPAFSQVKNINGEPYSDADLLEQLRLDFGQEPVESASTPIMGDKVTWQQPELSDDTFMVEDLSGKHVMALATYLKTDQWAKIKFTLTSNALFELYIDGEKKHTKKQAGSSNQVFTLDLHEGNHLITLKVLTTTDNLKFSGKLSYEKTFAGLTLEQSLNPRRALNIYDILNGTDIRSSSISSSGNYALVNYSRSKKGTSKSTNHTVIKDLNSMKNVMILRDPQISQVKWLPSSDRLSYTEKYQDAHNLYVYDLKTASEKMIAESIPDLGSYHWAPNEQYIVYSRSQEAEEPGSLKRIYGNEDRIPGFRNRSFLHLLDVKSGNSQQITAGNLSARLHDIRPDSRKILFSTSYPDYTQVPFSKQNLYEMDVETFTLDTLWKDKPYSGRGEYSPDGSQLLISGSPKTFGELGVNTSDDQLPNNYDGQLYLYDLNNRKATAITKTFKPAVGSAHWWNEETIYLSVTEKDATNLYRYNLRKERFEKVDLQVEVLNSIDYAQNKPRAIYRGTGMTQPEQIYLLELDKEESTLMEYAKEQELAHVAFGPTEEWNFTNSRGTTIDGRVYYPPNYDPDKKYPVIVYYYGGTSPVERSFDGRYPKNIWAGKGYIVYVLQPSGAIGFGQDFSALHVNGWGKEAIDDIIEGTQKFLEAHPAADADNVGAIGASYGGYTTMLLQTRTDLFKTAVSHAGISSISSYWGEGYWGYTYSAGASTYSYPWNNQELYVDNSPLYNADDFNNSILLLHGAADTNVPVGESKQFYAALKILGKDVEMVLVEGEDHWIIDYDKRIKWHHTILSWFDKKLKDEPGLWEEMYPEKHLQ